MDGIYANQCQDEDYVPTPTGLDIGRYKDAVYYREGLFSAIYKAAAPEDEGYFPPETPPKKRLVALKVTTPSMMEPPHDSKREARILGISASDHVIPLFESFREAGTRFVLVLPFMPHDFNQLLQDDRLSQGQIKHCLRDMFSALAFVHKKGIIHRDVKPSNILLKSLDGPAYLSDFGIAWAPDAIGSEAADSKITDVGTTCYRPPELLFGNKRYGCSLDLWAAGCTVAEALVPEHPTLFDSGELGSDLALIQSMFKKLGTPNLTVWPVSFFEMLSHSCKLISCRKQRVFRTGGRCNSTNIPRSRGQPYSLVFPTLSKNLSASWSDMKAGKG